MNTEKLEQFHKRHYKKLLIIPLLILILALVQIGTQYAQTGDFINKGVSLKGGISLRIETNYNDIDSLESFLANEFPKEDFDIRSLRQSTGENALLIEATEGVGEDNLLNAIKEKLGDQVPDIDEMASSLELIPSLSVMIAAFTGIVGTISVYNLLGFNMSAGGIAALLMLIGYSVDTDILLNSQVLKNHEGSVFERMFSAFKTLDY